MKKIMLATSTLVAILSQSAVAETLDQQSSILPVNTNSASDLTESVQVPSFDDSRHYFVGLTGGLSQFSITNRAKISGQSFDAPSPDRNVFAGIDFGIYAPNGKGRIYYSYQRHQADTKVNDVKALENTIDLHLLSGDYLFRPHKAISPFVGAHFGYTQIEGKATGEGSYRESGYVFGLQAGISWRITQQFTMDIGARHTVLPSESVKKWTGKISGDNHSVSFDTQPESISSVYMAVNYRF